LEWSKDKCVLYKKLKGLPKAILMETSMKKPKLQDLEIAGMSVCTTAGATGDWNVKLKGPELTMKFKGNLNPEANLMIGFCGNSIEELNTSFELTRGKSTVEVQTSPLII